MRRESWQTLVLLAATLATGLTAGVFGDWAHTVMRALATTDDRTFVVAFQALDRAILNPAFLLPFVGALLFSGVAVLLHRPTGGPVPPWTAVAFGLLLASFVITVVVHEPLNGILRDAGDPDGIADVTALRAAFDETRWVVWHAVRTVAATAGFACLAWALILHGRATGSADGHHFADDLGAPGPLSRRTGD
ncbi:MAG: DUF1772 domain-containing protein [Pseudonocardia sediminis]